MLAGLPSEPAAPGLKAGRIATSRGVQFLLAFRLGSGPEESGDAR
jgi:hypothetical protein